MSPLRPGTPFVLLDDARGGGATLYRDPVEIIAAHRRHELRPALARLRAAAARGQAVAGWIGYEAGHELEDRLAARPAKADPGLPILWFGAFETIEQIEAQHLPALLGDPAGAWLGRPVPRISEDDFHAAIAAIHALIAAGDIYQANYSFRLDLPVAGAPPAIYARMRGAGGGGWGGIVHDGANWLLSCSPELFFTLEGRRLTTRPMKGTLPATVDPARLASDPKQRAENLMIVDLLRNDLARVAAPGSVRVPRLFEIETYPTVHQMTSTVTADLAPGHDAIDVLEALFPCGSITGAPKIRAMEVIDAIEADARGPYTGTIGRVDSGGNAAFNVAIRTLIIAPGTSCATLGLGAGIVADSRAADEWRECLAKGEFVTANTQRFDLIETMLFDADEGVVDIGRHLARLKASADLFGFPCDRHALRNELQATTFRLRENCRVRLRLSESGAVAIEATPLPVTPAVADVALAPRGVAYEDFRLRHKTSDRSFYDAARKAAGTFEVALVDEDGFVTEGSFTNIFVERECRLLTPPLVRGLLPGILRQRLIDEGRAIEADITPADLADGFFIGNALRGLIPARLVAAPPASGL